MRRPVPLALIFIPIAALLVVCPLLIKGGSCGHDFDFHLISWMEAANQFSAGVWHPAWAFSPAWNAGEPRFVFYPPISWTLGALLGMVLPWAAVSIVYTWLALMAAGFGMYRLARALAATQANAAIAAVIYIANPYMIFTAYERTAYAELLASAWIPLLLAGILGERVMVLGVALPIALLWLTNAPAAVMGCYALALLAAIRLVFVCKSFRSNTMATLRASFDITGRVAGGFALGLGLAAFYVLPAAYERRWVQIAMAMVQGMRIGDNFLFHRTGDADHDAVLHTASVIAVLMLACAAIAVVVAALRIRNGTEARDDGDAGNFKNIPALYKRTITSIAMLVVLIAFLLTPFSAMVWSVAPEMAFLQFPWRLMTVLAAGLCALIPLALPPIRLRTTMFSATALALVAAISWPAAHRFWQPCDDQDRTAARRAVFVTKAGTDPTDEYTTGEADNDALLHGNPAYWLAQTDDVQPTQGVAMQVPMHFAVDVKTAATVVLNLRDYPGWQVKLNGTEVKTRTARADGLIAFPITAGHAQIDLSFGTTPDRRLGDGITLVALCSAFGFAALGRRWRAPSRIIEDQ